MRKLPILMNQEEHWQYMQEEGKLKLFLIKPLYVSLSIVITITLFNFIFDIVAYGFRTTVTIYTNNMSIQLSKMFLLWVIMFFIWALANIAFWVYYSITFKNKP